jgi:hypothetical protein
VAMEKAWQTTHYLIDRMGRGPRRSSIYNV